jgi:hypothetical protein
MGWLNENFWRGSFWLPFLYGYFINCLTYKQFAGKTSFLAGKVQKLAGK